MSLAEAEKYIQDAGHVRNVANKRGKIIEPAVRYLRHNEREKRREEARRIKDMLEPVNIQMAKMGAQSIAQARKHLNALEEDLELHSPPTDLSSETKDVLLRELKREEDIYRQGYLSHEEMRRNPVGAVDRNIRHSKAHKDRGLKIKNLRLLCFPECEEQDLCNLEDLRSSGIIPGSAQHYDTTAQLPGYMAYSHIPDEKWVEAGLPLVTPGSPLARKSAEELEAEIKELKAQLAAKDKPKAKIEAKPAKAKRVMSGEAKEKLRQGREKYWADRKAKQAQPAA